MTCFRLPTDFTVSKKTKTLTGYAALHIIILKAVYLEGGNKMEVEEVMTDRQYDGILQMIEMIVDGCKDLEEVKRKIAELRKEKNDKGKTE